MIPEDLIEKYGKDNLIITPPVICMETTRRIRQILWKRPDGKTVKLDKFIECEQL